MKARALVLLVSSICAPTIYAHGQITCTTDTQNLACVLPTSAAVLAASAVAQTQSQAAQDAAIAAARKVSNAVNSSIGTQLTQLPIPSGSVGVVSIQKAGYPLGVPYENLGPILTDRPDTVGKHRIFAGFSYQHFNFNAIDGISLGNLQVGFQNPQIVQIGNQPPDLQEVSSSESIKVRFQLDQYVGLATYGLTSTTDISIAVPYSNVSLSALSSNFKAYLYDSNSLQYQNVSLPAGTTISSSGTAHGIGDVIVNVKQELLGGEGRRPAIAAGFDVRFPTGDAVNYLGSGAYGYNLYGLFEYRRKVSPHFKMGYQWNSKSVLVTGPTNTEASLPGGLQYDVGADYSVFRRLTLAADVLGSQFVNSPSLVNSQLPFSPDLPTSGFPALDTVASTTTTYTTSNISAGAKFHLSRHWTLYGNVLVPLNNAGLRSDPVPLGGVSFNR